MANSCCLGLVGGLGIGATTHYYRKLAQAHEERGCELDLVIAHAEMSRVVDYVGARDCDGLSEYLISFIRRLKAAGAGIAAIPAVTPHFCLRQLRMSSPLPVLDIFNPLLDELAVRAVRRATVFGTRFVIESALFGLAGNLEIVQPRSDEVDYIHNTYMEVAQQGRGSYEQRRNLTVLAHTLQQRDRVDAIILAGTDLALLFNEYNTEFPYIDCTALHIQAILSALLSDTPPNLP